MTARKPPEQHNKNGRPTVMTPETIAKLEMAFGYGCSDLEACLFADIGKSTLYDYQELNPQFVERKELLKSKPVLLARQTLMKGIAGYEIKDPQGNVIKVINTPDAHLAMKFLEKKMHSEFKSAVDHSGSLTFDPSKHSQMMSKWFDHQEENGDQEEEDGDQDYTEDGITETNQPDEQQDEQREV